MRLYILLILIFISSSFVWADGKELQVSIDSYSIETRQLSPEISAKVLNFDGAVLDDGFGLLPLYIYRTPLGSETTNNLTARILNSYTSILSVPGMEEIADIEHIGKDFRISASIIHIEGKPFAEVMILPFRKYQTGQLEVIDSCVFELEILTGDPASGVFRSEFVESSVLSSGKWYRIATDETGIHKISYNDLSDMGISPASIDPRKIRIFGNGNGIVPEKNSDPRIDDLIENQIYVHGEEDGKFDEEDYILFYGQSSIVWRYIPFSGHGLFEHEINPYTDKTYYFLNIEDALGKRIPLVEYQGLTPTATVDEFTDYEVHDDDALNVLKTGRVWYGEVFGDETVYDYSFHFPNICQDYQVSLITNIAARSTIESSFDYYYNSQHLLNASISKIILGTTVYAWTSTPDTVGFYPAQGDQINLRVEYDKPGTTSIGWMNYIALNARRKLIFTGSHMSFRDHLSYGPGEVVEYHISGANSNLMVWDVTDPFNITRQKGSLSGDVYTMIAPADDIREFIAFDGSGYNTVEFIEEVQNQNLHSYSPVEYIILTYPDFMPQAERMLALHQTLDNMSGLIVTPQQIYNEFGSGKQDPAAIRDFVRMLYERGDQSTRPRYLLLLGDASYDYKDRVPANTNLVPAYQSVEALKEGYSFVTDDFFGLMDPEEGVNAYGKSVDIGIGRFPVHTVEQADAMVNKIEAYLTMKPEMLNSWRNNICFIADDENQNTHYTQAEKLQYMIDTGYQEYNRYKIYLDAFPQISTAAGERYPDVNKAINEMIGIGSLIINYTGHGGEGGLAHESILDIPTINSWTNLNRLPLFITATCEFSRYDNPAMISAGEFVFLNPGGGGIGLLTTSRLAWADPNFRLNKAVYEFMFKRPNGNYYKIGDIVCRAKTDQNNGTNIKNFVLLGDPAMQLAYPELVVETTAINGIEITQSQDTISAMSEVTVNGMITDFYGTAVQDFNGIIYPTVFDKEGTLSTLGNDVGSIPDEFHVLGQKLYEGKASVVNGQFSFSFFMPRNMAINYGPGKISYYAFDENNYRDAQGYFHVNTGGVNPNVNPDNQGPDMSLYLNNTDFISGGLTVDDPVFLAYIFDENGINSTGNGIGRDITLVLDENHQNAIILNDAFTPDMDSYQSGWISFPLSNLDDGLHTLTLKAWDNMNNSSEKTIEFEVSVNGAVALTQLKNYPNPFNNVTYFTFDHNKPENSFDIEILIFNINGQHVRTLKQTVAAEGLTISPLSWDGTDEGGSRIGNGVYVYRVFVTDKQGSLFVQTSKLIYTGGHD